MPGGSVPAGLISPFYPPSTQEALRIFGKGQPKHSRVLANQKPASQRRGFWLVDDPGPGPGGSVPVERGPNPSLVRFVGK